MYFATVEVLKMKKDQKKFQSFLNSSRLTQIRLRVGTLEDDTFKKGIKHEIFTFFKKDMLI